MSGGSAIDGDYVDRPGALGGIVQTHGFGELGPCGPADKSVSMPCAESAGSSRWWIPRGIDSGLGSKMLDYSVVPVLPILMAENKIVSRHRRVGTLFLEIIPFLSPLAKSSLCEEDVINIRT